MLQDLHFLINIKTADLKKLLNFLVILALVLSSKFTSNSDQLQFNKSVKLSSKIIQISSVAKIHQEMENISPLEASQVPATIETPNFEMEVEGSKDDLKVSRIPFENISQSFATGDQPQVSQSTEDQVPSAVRPSNLNFDSPQDQVHSKPTKQFLRFSEDVLQREFEKCASLYEAEQVPLKQASSSPERKVKQTNQVKGPSPKSPRRWSNSATSPVSRSDGESVQKRKAGIVPEEFLAGATEEALPYDPDEEFELIKAGRTSILGKGLSIGSPYLAATHWRLHLPRYQIHTAHRCTCVMIQAPRREQWRQDSIKANIEMLEESGFLRQPSMSTTITIGGMGVVLLVRITPTIRRRKQMITSGISRQGSDNFYENPLVLNFLTDEELNYICNGVNSMLHVRGCGDGDQAYENDARREVLTSWSKTNIKSYNPIVLMYLINQSSGLAKEAQKTYSFVICGRSSPTQQRSLWDSLQVTDAQPRQIEISGFHFELYKSAEKLVAARYASWASLEGRKTLVVRNVHSEIQLEEISKSFPNADYLYESQDEDRDRIIVITLGKGGPPDLPDLTSMAADDAVVEFLIQECSEVTSALRELRRFFTKNDSTASSWIKRGEPKTEEDGLHSGTVQVLPEASKDGGWFIQTKSGPVREPVSAATSSTTIAKAVSVKSQQPVVATTSQDEGQSENSLVAANTVVYQSYMEKALEQMQGMQRDQLEANRKMQDSFQMQEARLSEMQRDHRELVSKLEGRLEMLESKKRPIREEDVDISLTPSRRKPKDSTDTKEMELDTKGFRALSAEEEQEFRSSNEAIVTEDEFRITLQVDEGAPNDAMILVDFPGSQDQDEVMAVVNNPFKIAVVSDQGLVLNRLGQYATSLGLGAKATIPIPKGSKIRCYGERIDQEELQRRRAAGQDQYIMANSGLSTIIDGYAARQAGDVASAINSANHVWCQVNNRLAKANVKLIFSEGSFAYIALNDIMAGQPIYTAYGTSHRLQSGSELHGITPKDPFTKEATDALERRIKRVEVQSKGYFMKVTGYQNGAKFLEPLAMMIHWGRVDEVQRLLEDNLRVEMSLRTAGNREDIFRITNTTNGLCFWDAQFRIHCTHYEKPWASKWADRKMDLLKYIQKQLIVLEATVISSDEQDSEVKEEAIKLGRSAIIECSKDNPSHPEWGSTSHFTLYNRELSKALWRQKSKGFYVLTNTPDHCGGDHTIRSIEKCVSAYNVLWEASHFCMIKHPAVDVSILSQLELALVSATLHQLNVSTRDKLV